MSTLPTNIPNVRLTQHALARIAEREYSTAEIDTMLSSIDSRLVVHVITVLPKEACKLSKQLTCARKTLAKCKRQKAIKRWTRNVCLLEEQVCLTQKPAQPAIVKSTEDLVQLRACINSLRDVLNRV